MGLTKDNENSQLQHSTCPLALRNFKTVILVRKSGLQLANQHPTNHIIYESDANNGKIPSRFGLEKCFISYQEQNRYYYETFVDLQYS